MNCLTPIRSPELRSTPANCRNLDTWAAEGMADDCPCMPRTVAYGSRDGFLSPPLWPRRAGRPTEIEMFAQSGTA